MNSIPSLAKAHVLSGESSVPCRLRQHRPFIISSCVKGSFHRMATLKGADTLEQLLFLRMTDSQNLLKSTQVDERECPVRALWVSSLLPPTSDGPDDATWSGRRRGAAIGQRRPSGLASSPPVDRWNIEDGRTLALAWACKMGTLAAPYTYTAGAHVLAALAWLIDMSRVAPSLWLTSFSLPVCPLSLSLISIQLCPRTTSPRTRWDPHKATGAGPGLPHCGRKVIPVTRMRGNCCLIV